MTRAHSFADFEGKMQARAALFVEPWGAVEQRGHKCSIFLFFFFFSVGESPFKNRAFVN